MAGCGCNKSRVRTTRLRGSSKTVPQQQKKTAAGAAPKPKRTIPQAPPKTATEKSVASQIEKIKERIRRQRSSD